jgi:zinc carboxypeptidase
MMHAEAFRMVPRVSLVLALTVAIGGLLAAHGRGETTPAPQAAKPQATSSSPAGLASLATLKTTAEASDYKSTSSYTDVVTFMKAVADAAPALVHYTTYGMTSEQRPMPLAVVGTGLKDSSAAAVRASGKLRVHVQANIHAGEVEGKESAQVLLRDLAMGKHDDWLKSMVFLITPIFNADGNEKFSLTNRQRQNGPINGEGTRQNAQGININRDFMKLETPEGQAFAKLWIDYDPEVGFDLHTSDGSTHGYYLTYAPPLNPDTSDAIMSIMKDEWFPFVTKSIKDKHGWDTFYYGNVSTGARGGGGGRGRGAPTPEACASIADGRAAGRGRGAGGATPPGQPAPGRRGAAGSPTPETVGAPAPPAAPRIWATFEHLPRYHNSYVGMRNRFALLSEAYAYATFEDRIKATNYFLEESLNFAAVNAARLKKAVQTADKESLIGKTEGTRAAMKRDGMIDVLMGEVEDEINPNTGTAMNRRKDVVHHEQMVDMLWFEPTTTAVVPSAYYVPADATKAIELLKRHGILMRQVTSPVSTLSAFAISDSAFQCNGPSIDTGTHNLHWLEGTWSAPAASVTAPAGSWMVPMNQPLARLAFYLIEPTSDDGLTIWNYLDDLLKDAKTYPILAKR